MTQEHEASTEPVLEEVEQVSPEVVEPTQPSLDDKMAELIQRKVAEELAKVTEASKREIQSAKDKARSEVESALRRARLAEGTLGATRTHLQGLDPETARDFELAQLRAESQGRLSLEQEDQARRQQETYGQALNDSLHAHLAELGIDPNDDRIDWATESPDYVSGRRRFDTSVTKIIKENASALEGSIDKKIKEATEKMKKDLGVEDANSVDTAVSGGVSKSGIPTDINKFRTWVENLPQEEYVKLKPEIDKMQASGGIK